MSTFASCPDITKQTVRATFSCLSVSVLIPPEGIAQASGLTIDAANRWQSYLEIEFHLSTVPAARGSSVVCIVFRLDVLSSRPSHLFRRGWDEVPIFDENLSRLPNLREVILETTDVRDSADLAAGLVRTRDKVRRRTCAESQQLALDVGNGVFLEGAYPVVSPLWDTGYERDQERW